MGLTERIIRDAKPGQKTQIIWDKQVTGLGLRITKAGVKSFILNYRVDGRERRATLARAEEISLKAVRERAGDELVAIRNGEADPLQRREAARTAPSVNDGLDRFFEEFVPARMAMDRLKKSTVIVYQHQAKKYVSPRLGNLKITAVTRHDIEDAVHGLPVSQRNRTLAFISRLFSQFEDWELRPQNSNPARRIERAREEPRDRVLSPSELAALAVALSEYEKRFPMPVAAIRVAAVTGLRIGEVLAIQWDHVCFETGRLTMPETKTGRRVHDLPVAALEILADLPRIHENPWIFTMRTGKPTYSYVRKVFQQVAASAGLTGVRLHDLRRTVMTSAAAAGVGTHVLRDLLGHKSTVMADRYIRAVGNPVREAREQVGAQMAAMMAGKAGEVVRLRGR